MNLTELSKAAFQNAKAHGFNETEDIERTLMLIITEIGEAVDAHRKGWRAEGNRSWYDAVIEKTTDIDKRMTAFEGYIKNNLEDELADVVIRIASLCGACADNLEADKEQWKAAERQATWMHTNVSFPAMCLHLCHSIFTANSVRNCNGYRWLDAVKFVAWQVIEYCKLVGIDLDWYINAKMEYNKHRQPMHGNCKY